MKHQILIVEDDQFSRELLEDWLGIEGYEVEGVTSLKAGFEAVQKNPPHLVLLDVGLGTDDGLALASWMQQQPGLRQIPIIAVTAHAIITERDRMTQSGCTAIIPKPVNFKLLAEQLQAALSSSD